MIAGGASLAPRRWSWPASAMLARSRSACSLTAWMTATRNARNCALACGSFPGSSRFSPSSVAIDQLLCLPEPLIPAKGFSWMRNMSPWRGASRRIMLITIMLWSEPTEVASYTGAISNWPGATSLCRVFAGIPRRHSSRSRSIMNARIRSRIGPKYWSSSSWPLGGAAPKRVRPGQHQVGSLLGKMPVDEEVLLLRPDVREDAGRARVAEPAQDPQRLLAEGLLRPEERDLVVQRLARVRHEGRRDRHRDAVGLDLEEDRARDVPRRVAAGLERGPDPARREGAGVRLALDEVRARRIRRSSGRRSWGSGTSRASPRSSPSSGRTSACSGWRHAPSPIPSRRGRPRPRSPGRTARDPRSSVAAS